MKRQAIRIGKDVAVAAAKLERATSQAESTITRFLPNRSAMLPISGAATATPIVAAPTVRLTDALRAMKDADEFWQKRLRGKQAEKGTKAGKHHRELAHSFPFCTRHREQEELGIWPVLTS